mmetsp:Transcript_12974/g.25381  ORF Transcript_12974/g.25381 Transcript_12974/m.25381 type:complete len:95 (+) Transcript_12974:260-544(+)
MINSSKRSVGATNGQKKNYSDFFFYAFSSIVELAGDGEAVGTSVVWNEDPGPSLISPGVDVSGVGDMVGKVVADICDLAGASDGDELGKSANGR